MEENENKQEPSLNTDELKNETVDTVKQVKETMKNVNVREEAEATKGFVMEMFKNPLEKIKEIANDSSNKHFKTAIVLVIIWMLVVLVDNISFSAISFSYLFKTILEYVKVILGPVVTVVVMSLIIFVMNQKTKRSLVTILTTIATVKLPIIIARTIGLLTIISFKILTITSVVSSLLSVISTVFLYFAIRDLYGEEDEKQAFKNFVITEVIYLGISLAISYLGIYI